jgi:putative nucleotide binding protein
MMREKEEQAIVIDFLPYGYPLEKKMMPIAQAIGKKNFTLLEIVPRRGLKLETGEEVYIGEGKRDKVYYILGKLEFSKISESGKKFIEEYIEKQITADEKRFVDFFNSSQPINTRLHQLELLPGFGAKHTKAILEEKEKKPFESFEDLKKRISNLPDPKTAIVKRIIEELKGEERHLLFVHG